MRGHTTMILKLQQALNVRGEKILLRTSQFYSMNLGNVVTIYYVDKAYYDEESGKTKKNELFHTTSQLQELLFLNDLLCISRGDPLPTDNEIWNEKRKEIDFFTKLAETEE